MAEQIDLGPRPPRKGRPTADELKRRAAANSKAAAKAKVGRMAVEGGLFLSEMARFHAEARNVWAVIWCGPCFRPQTVMACTKRQNITGTIGPWQIASMGAGKTPAVFTFA